METKPIYIICGAAATGKSTFGKKLAKELGAGLLDIDTVTERLAKTALRARGMDEDDRDSPEYKALLREPIYETLFDCGIEMAQAVPVIIIGPFTTECRDPLWPSKLQDRLGITPTFYYLACDLETLKQRIRKRGNPRDTGKLQNWENYTAYSLDTEPPAFPHIYVDTSDA